LKTVKRRRNYDEIRPAGGDTAMPLNMQKRLRLIQEFFELERKSLLDAGCGAGEYVSAFLKAGADAMGIEYSAEKVAQYENRNPDSGRVQQGNLEKLPFPDQQFDLVLLNEVLEHVQNEDAALREIHRVLRPSAHLIVFSPNRLYPFETHGVSLRRSNKAVPHYFPFVPYVPLSLGSRFLNYWARNYWPSQLRKLLVGSGFKVTHHRFVWQTFENISGNQPKIVQAGRPWLRAISDQCEKAPLLKYFGTSQMIVAERL